MNKATLAIMAALSTSIALADDFKTIDGKEYKNVTVKRVEPDGIVLISKSGISKVYFTKLPKEVQQRFNYDPEKAAAYSATANPQLQPSSTAATDSQGAADLMSHAESALRTGQFGQGAELLNRIVSEYPVSPQAKTVRDLRSSLRDKEPTQDGPLTASEAQRLRSTMDALANIKKGYRTATPEKRQALETILGAETFQDTSANPNAAEPMAKSGIETLPPITVKLNDELLNALKMTDKLDALYKRGCSSAEFVAAAMPVESVFMNLQNKLPKGDPRRDLSANTFEAYQQLALAMKANEQGKGERPDATFAAAGIRKGMLMKILQGNMTPAERNLYDVWRKATETNP
jgi:hypothetical protein